MILKTHKHFTKAETVAALLETSQPAIALQSITIAVSGGPGNPRDWVGLFRCGDADANSIDWWYLNWSKKQPKKGLTSGNVVFHFPSAPGDYEVRFLVATGTSTYTCLSKTIVVTIGDPIVTEEIDSISDETGAVLYSP